MKVNRTVFLAAAASMAAGAAACNRMPAESGSTFADPGSTEQVDSGAPCTSTGQGGGEDASDASVASDGSIGDADASDADASDADASDAEAGLPTGDVNEICAPFTCEIAEVSCRAALLGGLSLSASTALYACAQRDCRDPDASWDELTRDGVACATAAMGGGGSSPGPDPMCIGLVGCDASASGDPLLTAGRCEAIFSNLTYAGIGSLSSSNPTCESVEWTYVRQVLFQLGYP